MCPVHCTDGHRKPGGPESHAGCYFTALGSMLYVSCNISPGGSCEYHLYSGSKGTAKVKAFQNCFLALRGAYDIDLLALSHPSDTITAFWSHSWHGQRWKKILTLITIYNGLAAIGLGMFIAVVMMVLSLVLDLPDYDRHDMRETDWSAWSSWSGFLVTALVMTFWRPQTRVFLDSTCISQSNEDLKAAGISGAGWVRFTLLGIIFDYSDYRAES